MSKKVEAESPSSLLPLPEIVVEHHLKTLGPAMSEWLELGRIPPVMLVTGIRGVGKRAICQYLSQWALCEKTGFAKSNSEFEMPSLFGGPDPAAERKSSGNALSGPCGECSSCKRALKGQWIDFTELTPETTSESGQGATLKIEQFRTLKASMGFGAHEGAFKITLIPDADRMTLQASNSVLKLLEEPPPGWIFLLTASDPGLLLPTILSRCQSVRLKPFPKEKLKDLLAQNGVETRKLEVVSELAQGSWGRGIALSSDELWEQRRDILGFLKNPAASLNALVEWSSAEPANLEFLVDSLEQATSEFVRWTVEPSYAWVNSDARLAMDEHAAKLVNKHGTRDRARGFWLERAESLAKARHSLRIPLNKKLFAQSLLIPWVLE